LVYMAVVWIEYGLHIIALKRCRTRHR
jgi:hypothetical protein